MTYFVLIGHSHGTLGHFAAHRSDKTRFNKMGSGELKLTEMR